MPRKSMARLCLAMTSSHFGLWPLFSKILCVIGLFDYFRVTSVWLKVRSVELLVSLYSAMQLSSTVVLWTNSTGGETTL